MIPGIATFLEGYYLIARRLHAIARYSRSHLARALAEAEALTAGNEHDEPAALFFALSRHYAAFGDVAREGAGDLWPPAVELFARGRAHALGFELAIDSIELAHLRLDVAIGEIGYAEVRDRFAARLRRVTPRSWPPAL